jgi:hypothetical protein
MILFQKIKRALQQITLGIRPGVLVLEIEFGGNPYPRSNVLLYA